MARNLIQEMGKNAVLEEIYREIQLVYLHDQRPWVIGYSGGKDSTVTAMVVFNAISQLPEEQRTKDIHIVSSDTMVENPLILDYLEQNIDMMHCAANESNLPIIPKLVKPETSETFWSLLLGKGYPSPRQKFRWCTHRLKIKPIDVYINELAQQNDSGVVVVLGVRSAESNSRKSTIEEHTIEGKILKTHTTNTNAMVYAPIEHLSNDDVWACLLNSTTPWGFDNNLLLSLYRDASDESECPVQQDPNAPSCGQSRFGCWVCTVVSKDKSLSGFIQNDYDELRPLLKFRNHLVDVRENHEYRQNYRMNGTIYYVGKEHDRRGLGPFSLTGRIKLMRSLLVAEKAFNKNLKFAETNTFSLNTNQYIELITRKELRHIRELWIEEGDWADTLPTLYEEIIGEPFYSGYVNQPFINESDYKDLEGICKESNLDPSLVKSLITLENKYVGLGHRTNIYSKIDRILNQDIVHEELYELNRRNDDEAETINNN